MSSELAVRDSGEILIEDVVAAVKSHPRLPDLLHGNGQYGIVELIRIDAYQRDVWPDGVMTYDRDRIRGLIGMLESLPAHDHLSPERTRRWRDALDAIVNDISAAVIAAHLRWLDEHFPGRTDNQADAERYVRETATDCIQPAGANG